jgi:hypothetical protein
MQPHRIAIERRRDGWKRRWQWLTLAGCVVAASGCEEESRQPASKPIIGQRTQEIRNAAPELEKGGAKAVTPRITARDPITLTGNAYVSLIGQASVLAIQHAMDLYHATNDRYPKDYDEFMTEIIKANGIALPKLPLYQEYGYDEKEHKLIILEYQARKDEPVR